MAIRSELLLIGGSGFIAVPTDAAVGVPAAADASSAAKIAREHPQQTDREILFMGFTLSTVQSERLMTASDSPKDHDVGRRFHRQR